jgi:hypothetical protein
MSNIFFSYAHEDLERIQQIVSALEEQSWTVFWDRRIPAGKDWRSYIGKALDEAKCLLVAWSQHSVNSPWVMEEADEGKRRGIFVPVMLDDAEPPRGFRGIQAANLTDWQPGQESIPFKQFLEDVRSILDAPSIAPKAEMDQAKAIKQPEERIAPRKPNLFLKLIKYGVGALILGSIIVLVYFGYQKWIVTLPQKNHNGALIPKVLVYDEGPFHIGDENIPGWAPLHGPCYEKEFFVDMPIGKYNLTLCRFGVEEAVITLNDKFVCPLPEQEPRPRILRPNYWSDELTINLKTHFMVKGKNILRICAQTVKDPDREGDIDDFQLKNIKIIALTPAIIPPPHDN